MIRRWSYINKLNNFFENYENFFFLKKKFKLILFKKTVNFRSFRRLRLLNSKFKRKAFMRLKHSTNLVKYNNIFKWWTLDFMINRLISKNQFSLNLFVNNFYSYNYLFLKNKNINLFYNNSFFLSNLTKQTYSFATNNLFLGKKFFFKNNNLTFSFFLESNNNNSSLSLVNPNLHSGNLSSPVSFFFSEWDNQFFLNAFSNSFVNKDDLLNVNIFFPICLLQFSQILEIYKIFVYYFFFFLFL